MFDDYVELAERTIRAEWTKVQERFQTIQFNESATTTIQMMAEAINQIVPPPKKIKTIITEELNRLKDSAIPLPIGLTWESFQRLARDSWPLHPTVLLAIPHLFRRLAQNERSIFSYLTSNEPYGFHEHIQNPLDNDSGFVLLHDIYSYLLANFEVGLARLPHAKRLLEANDVINSRHNLTKNEYDLIRTIALLNVLGDISPIRATQKLLQCTRDNTSDIEKDLNTLKQQSIVTYRKLDCSYRVWEGSDVDIDTRMKDARRHMQMQGNSLLDTLRSHLPERILAARRHNMVTGAQRYFKILYVEHIEKPEHYSEMEFPGDASGVVVVLLPNSDTGYLKRAAQNVSKAQKISGSYVYISEGNMESGK